MTAARHDAVHPVHAAPMGEWPVAPRFIVLATPSPLAPVPEAAPAVPADELAPVAVAPEPEAEAVAAPPAVVWPEPEPEAEVVVAPEPEPEAVVAPEPEAEAVVAPELAAEVVVAPEPEAEAVVAPEPEAEVVVAPEAVAEPAMALTPSPSEGRVIEPVASPSHAETVALTAPPVELVAEPEAAMPDAADPEAIAPDPAPLDEAVSEAATPEAEEAVAEEAVAVAPAAPQAPVAPAPPVAPVAPAPPVALGALADAPAPHAHAMPVPAPPSLPAPSAPVLNPSGAGAPAVAVADATANATAPAPAQPAPAEPIQMPQQPAFDPVVAPWPLEYVADLRPSDDDGGSRQFPTPSRNLIAIALLAGAAGLFALRGIGGDEPAPAPVPAAGTPAQTAPAAGSKDWASAVPRALPPGIVDAVSLDERELRPARMRHQLELAIAAMKPGEVIRELTVRTDGTLMLMVVQGNQSRFVVTKGKAPAAPATPALAAGATPPPILAIDPIEIDARIPRKLLRAVERSKGVPPSSMKLIRGADIRGGKPTWVLRWEGQPGKPTTQLFATADGHAIATSMAALG